MDEVEAHKRLRLNNYDTEALHFLYYGKYDEVDAYERGLAEGEAVGLERAAEIVTTYLDPQYGKSEALLAMTLKDEAAKVREGLSA